MKPGIFFVIIFIFTVFPCSTEELTYKAGDISIKIETGEEWLHDFPFFLGLTKKNPPQFALWLEETDGTYISTIFATYKIAVEGWHANKGNRRKESLPHWCFKRGVVYDDGLLLPTKENPLSDGITGPTPKIDKEIQVRIENFTGPLIIKAEFNHSVDWNDYYLKKAEAEDDNYSGGKMGSGQPAVVYAGTIDPNQQFTSLILIGHSSADGTDGGIYSDLEKLTTAKNIVKQISIEIRK